ncbi:MAG TPA: glycosyltransferase, partial [Hanamia sp.]|nr:glycosyltransferase [Hanamia sp.]
LMVIAEKFNLPKKQIIVKSARRNEVPALLSLSEFSAFFIKPCYSKKSSSPTKHGEIMAMGIPVIINAGVGDVSYIVEKYQSGIVLKDLNQSEYQSAVSQISKRINFNQNEIRNAAGEFYNLDNAIEKYHKIYNQILA